MTKQVDASDLTVLSNEDLDYLHERYKVSEEAWLEELERRGLTTTDRGIEIQADIAEVSPEPANEPETTEYSSMTKAQLVELAEARGFEIESKATIAQITAALVADDQES